MAGSASDVTQAYNESLAINVKGSLGDVCTASDASIFNGTFVKPIDKGSLAPPNGSGYIVRVHARSGVQEGLMLDLKSGMSDLSIEVEFRIDPKLPAPGLAFGFADGLNQTIASVISIQDGVHMIVDEKGCGKASVLFPKIPVLKGDYKVTVFLITEDALHPYDQVEHCIKFRITQDHYEQGIVSLPHKWQIP